MQLDWVTVGAQAANFLILVWLLQRFLYRPVTAAMARREARLAGIRREAEVARDEARAEAGRWRDLRDGLDADRAREMAAAREAAAAERHALEQAARREVEARKRAWLDEIEHEKSAFLADLRARAAAHVYAAVGRALDDLAGAGLEDRAGGALAERLAQLDATTAARLREECVRAGRRVVVRSRFPVPEAARERIVAAVRAHVHDAAGVGFETGATFPWGIELRTGGQTLAWTTDGFVEGLERDARRRIEALSSAAG